MAKDLISRENALRHLKNNLGSDADDLIACLGEKPKKAVRVNTLKARPEEIAALLSLTEKTAYCESAYLYDSELSLGNHPYHKAGLFYIQEPSAMLAVEAAAPHLKALFASVDYPLVLDLCAAPGGKSGQLAEILAGRGALVSNEVDFSRAKTLASNMERLGVRNGQIISCFPAFIAEKAHGMFDAVAVDAPCSGEGMLRKEEAAWNNMNERTMLACVARQAEILKSAVALVRDGGLLVYSTCTLNEVENENVLAPFIESGELVPLECPHIGSARLSKRFPAYRAFPQDGGGEGHFVCVLRRKNGEPPMRRKLRRDTVKSLNLSSLAALMKEPPKEVAVFNDDILLCPPMPDISCRTLRKGVQIATLHNKAISPAHGLAAMLTKDEAIPTLDFHCETGSPEEKAKGRLALEKYLHGEELPAEKSPAGWGLVCADGYPLGLVKISGGTAKNHYPKGLRI